MSAFKQFLAKDIKVVPFTVNKQFSFDNSKFYADEDELYGYKQFVGIERFLGTNLSGSLFETSTDPTTGHSQSLYQRQVYNSVKELYYSNYISSSWGDPGTSIQRQSISGSYNTPSYYNYLSSTLTASRYFPTSSNDQLTVISIPSKLFGEYIQPKSFKFEYEDTSSTRLTILDDGEGNLYASSSYSWYSGSVDVQSIQTYFEYFEDEFATNAFNTLIFHEITIPSGYTLTEINYSPEENTPFFINYPPFQTTSTLRGNDLDYFNVNINGIQGDMAQGFFTSSNNPQPEDIITLTYELNGPISSGSISTNENVGNIIYEHGMAIITNQEVPLSNLANSYNVSSSFLSSMTILETQYKCTIRDNEFNFSLNPSQTSGSLSISSSMGTFNSAGETLYNYVTGSYFSPYITTVGLYDDYQNLIAVGKLSQPLQSSDTTDTTILINLDF